MAKEIIISTKNASTTNGGAFQGWGTSLCWWANRVGYSPALTNKAAELLESDYMKNLLEDLKEYYDYILIDSPPVSRVNDACIMAKYVDGTIIVSSSNEVDIELAKLTKKRLMKVNANFIGVVLNKFKDEDNIYHRYYGEYGELEQNKFKAKLKKIFKR